MKRLFALVPAALIAIAGCGETCSTAATPVNDVTNGCSIIAASQAATISLRLCPACADTAPTCTGEVRPNNEIHLDSVVQQCQNNTGCATACSISPVTCTLDQPLTAGVTYNVLYTTASGAGQTSVTAQAGGPASCTL